MKIAKSNLSFDAFGKPVFQFEMEPETSLEYDALKAMGFCIEAGKRGSPPTWNEHMALKVQGGERLDNGNFVFYTLWQVDR